VSIWSPDGRRKIGSAGVAEREAVKVLTDVGGDREWWIWNPRSRIGHLRVALTAAEFEQVPPGVAIADAGESGPERRRTQVVRAQ
jgi:hypothetical protein